MYDDDDRDPACIGYGVTPHHAPRLSPWPNESLCPECLAILDADIAAGRPLRGAWRLHIPGQPDQSLNSTFDGPGA